MHHVSSTYGADAILYTMLVKNILISQQPEKQLYFVGATELDLHGGQLCLIGEHEDFEYVMMTDPEITYEFSFHKPGPALVTLKYQEHSVQLQVNVKNPALKKLHIIKKPDKTLYVEGEMLDLTGLRLMAEYESGEKRELETLPEIKHQVQKGEAVYSLSIDSATIPIFYKVQTAQLTGIRVGKLPSCIEYLERKDNFSPSGGTVIHIYNSGTEEEKPMRPEWVRGFSNLHPGPVTLTVQIGRFTDTFDVTIRAKTATSLMIVKEPDQLNYIEGQKIDLSGLKLQVLYDNGESLLTEQWDYKPKIAQLITHAVDIIVDKVNISLPIGVSPRQLIGIELLSMPQKHSYLEQKEDLDLTGAQLRLLYNYGEAQSLDIQAEMVFGFDNQQIGPCKLEVQYRGFTTTFIVEIIPSQLIGLLITKNPNKGLYAPGERFDPTGMEVCGFYSNGKLRILSHYSILPDRALRKDDVAVTVGNMDKTAVVPVQVDDMFHQTTEPDVEAAPHTPALSSHPKSQSVQSSSIEEKPQPLWNRNFYPTTEKMRGFGK